MERETVTGCAIDSEAEQRKELLGAIARGWCHLKNSHKTMDADLADAIATEVMPLLSRARCGWPDPTPEMLKTPEFDAVWNCIRSWDIHVPAAYSGYCGATGNHVRAILDALAPLKTTP